MNANWSLVLNVVLLLGVVVSIVRLIRLRSKISGHSPCSSPLDSVSQDSNFDDIISVRKVSSDDNDLANLNIKISAASADSHMDGHGVNARVDANIESQQSAQFKADPNKSLMLFLVAKDGQTFAGYDLLQSVLASGLRFGEGSIFHKYQNANGQGTVLFSLAAATADGKFDLQNIGSFSVRGLCLYMYISGNSNIDNERFNMMVVTAKFLAEDLHARLLDDKQQVFDDLSVDYYRSYLNGVKQESVV